MTEHKEERGLFGRFIRHPWTAITAGFGAIGGGLGLFDPFGLVMTLFHVVGATAGTWFPMLGVLRGLSGLLEFIPSGLTTKLFIAGAVVYLAYLSRNLVTQALEILKRKKT